MEGPPRVHAQVLVVDDDDEFRISVARTLEGRGYSVTHAASGEAALDAADDVIPALVVLDICLPGICGYQVCHDLRARFGDGLPIVFVSAARKESYDRVAALLVGGDEYLAKPISPDELLLRVARLIRRSTPINPNVSVRLTSREREVLRLIAEGLALGEIASRLIITEKTVSTHLDHIFSKLGVHSRAQAVALAFKRDLVDRVAGSGAQ